MNNQIEINKDGRNLIFRVTVEHDADHAEPWIEEDGHGPVSDWRRQNYAGRYDKAPGEILLHEDSRQARFYDFQTACRQALAEAWDAQPYNTGHETPRQQAAKAARADFESLRRWCAGEWSYVGVIVTLLDEDDEETEISASIWGISSEDDEHLTATAQELADEIAAGYGTSWTTTTRETYAHTGA